MAGFSSKSGQTSILFTFILLIVLMPALVLLIHKPVSFDYSSEYSSQLLRSLLSMNIENFTLMDYIYFSSCGYDSDYSYFVNKFINDSVRDDFKYLIKVGNDSFTNIDGYVTVPKSYSSSYTVIGCSNITVSATVLQ